MTGPFLSRFHKVKINDSKSEVMWNGVSIFYSAGPPLDMLRDVSDSWRSAFSYIHTGMIINSDKQNEVTHNCAHTPPHVPSYEGNHLPFHTLKSKQTSHCCQEHRPKIKRYISKMSNGRFSHISGNITCHYRCLLPVNTGIEHQLQQWEHLCSFSPNLSNSGF